MKMSFNNHYGVPIEIEVGLTKQIKETFPQCIGCIESEETFERKSFYCLHYGPCNLTPIIGKIDEN